jgi:DNA-binding MarR family transcriptional regulator/predicted GNAT family N-acyltransferase
MGAAADGGLAERVEALRRFNRFYTRKIGVLQERLVASPFSLAEARVIYELARQQRPTASAVAAALELDAGYLSRILRDLEREGLLARAPAEDDARQRLLTLTTSGHDAFIALDRGSRDAMGAVLAALSPADQGRVLALMTGIEGLLGESSGGPGYVLRPPRAGDLGWVVAAHGRVYSEEYGWDERLEAFVAEVVAAFIRRHDPWRERCWIAERDGDPVGSVFLLEHAKTVAQLRLLLVDRKGRGCGIGVRLVEECLRFARQAEYRKVTLWTHSILHAAREIYQAAGFQRTRTERHSSFGPELVGEYWEMKL